MSTRCVIVIVTLLMSGSAHATASLQDEAASPPSDMMPAETIEPARASPRFDRSDCAAQEALCRADCTGAAEKRACLDRCTPQLAHCLSALPVDKTVTLPASCRAADQEAVHAIERQGELLDADPTLFAESFATLVRARIACRAGLTSDALDFYDEIRESLREKVVPDGLARRAD
jgi:hypothetical protein